MSADYDDYQDHDSPTGRYSRTIDRQTEAPRGSQTRAVLMALVIIFVVMLVTSVGEPLKNGYISPLDAIDPLNGGVLGEWVGRLGGAPVISRLSSSRSRPGSMAGVAPWDTQLPCWSVCRWF